MTTKVTPHEALMACLSKAGTQQQLATDLGCSQTAVWKMVQVRRISVPYVIRAEELYGVSRHDLRPDIYPRPIDARETIVDQCSDLRFHGVDHEPRRSAA